MNKQQFAELKQSAAQLLSQGQLAQAKNIVGALHQAKPKDLEVNWLVADVFLLEGHPADAVKLLSQCLELASGANLRARVLERLVDVCGKHGLDRNGVDFCRQWLAISPKNVKASFFLGVFLNNKRQYAEAIDAFKKTLKLEEGRAWTHVYLAGAYNHSGDFENSYAHYKRALELEPDNLTFPTYYLYATNGMTHINESEVVADHLAYGEKLEKKFAPKIHNAPEVRPEKLRVAYIGSEFRCHSVTYFLLPLLKGLDRTRYEVVCYSDTEKFDDYSQKLKDLFTLWRDIKGKPQQAVLDQMSNDRIDILVDLNGYTGKFRMDLFALKAAPIQVSYLGYPNTTGLQRIDYRLSDDWADPAGMTESLHSEELVRLPGGFLCFEPDVEATENLEHEVKRERDGIGFGSFNAFHKFNAQVVAAWSQILLRVPDSYLLIKNRSMGDQHIRASVLKLFENNGIPEDRIVMLDHTESKRAHFELYDQVDLHLDTFPYNGTTTTCEALWQGVPTVTFAGPTHRTRVSTSIMNQVGLSDFVAKDVEGYVDLAVAKVQDLAALQALRQGMRERMLNSPLMDTKRFADELSDAYEMMYQRFIESGKS